MRDKEHERGARDGETENGGLLNVDLWALRFPSLWPLLCRRDAGYHRFWLTDPSAYPKLN